MRRIVGRSKIAIWICAILVFLMSACGSNQSATSQKASGNGTMTMSIQGPVSTLDPAIGLSYQAGQINEALYDTLVYRDSTGKIIAGLARSWTITPTRNTFTLKTGATCSDGTKVTPEVVAASLQRYFAPATKAAGVSNAIGTGNTATVTADNSANTVTIALVKPYGGVLTALSRSSTGIVCPAGIADPSTMATHSAGSGPFVMQSEVSGSTYTMVRRKDYNWGPAAPGQPTGQLPRKLIAKVVTDESTGANLMLTGALDISQFTGPNVTRVDRQKGFTSSVQAQSLTFLMFNELKGYPTAKESVRLAISQVINRKAINKAQSNGRGALMSTLGRSPFTCASEDPAKLIPKYNPSAARPALRGLKLRMIGTKILNNGAGQDYVQAALENAGASVSLDNMNNEGWVTDITTGKNGWDLTILVLGNGSGDFFSSSSFMTGAIPPHGLNIANIDNQIANSAAATATASTGSPQCEGFGKMQSELLRRHDILPIATAPVTTVFGSRAVGLTSFGVMNAGSFRIK